MKICSSANARAELPRVGGGAPRAFPHDDVRTRLRLGHRAQEATLELVKLFRGARFLLAATLFGVACGGCFSPAASPSEIAAPIQARLVSGPWRLVDYRPNVPLEPILQALLAEQLRTMIVRFDGRVLDAQSPTLHITRPYTLENISGLSFDLISPDFQGGGALRSHCFFDPTGNQLTFHTDTDPWTGFGALQH